MTRNKDVTDAEILERLNKAAKEKGIVLTYTHKLFFLRLLNLCASEGRETENGLEITKSTQQLAVALNISPRAVTQSLKRLLDCGAILRRVGEKPFPSCYAYVTTIVPEFYN
jgi:DNA-binding MarR family transcriptional regulator